MTNLCTLLHKAKIKINGVPLQYLLIPRLLTGSAHSIEYLIDYIINTVAQNKCTTLLLELYLELTLVLSPFSIVLQKPGVVYVQSRFLIKFYEFYDYINVQKAKLWLYLS